MTTRKMFKRDCTVIKIDTETGLPSLHPKVAKVLRECKAKETSRYAIKNIGCGENWLAATNGRHLCALTFEHKFPEGTYVLTRDNLLLKSVQSAHFPKWNDLPMKKGHRRLCYDGPLNNGKHISTIVYAINSTADTNLWLDLFLKPLQYLASLDLDVKVYYRSGKKGEAPFEIHGDFGAAHVLYMQMPLTKERVVTE
jgi:hypothetical protein